MWKYLWVQEAPHGWLLNHHRERAYNIFDFIAALTALTALALICGSLMREELPAGFASTIKLAFTCSSVAVGYAYYLRKVQLSDTSFEYSVLAGLFIVTAVGQYAAVFPVDATQRNRALLLATTFSKPYPTLLGLRINSCVFYTVWCFFHECMSSIVMNGMHGDPFPPRYYLVLVLMHAMHLVMAKHQQVSLRQLFDAQQALSAEKLAVESLVEQLTAEKVAVESLVVQLTAEKSAVESLVEQLQTEKAASVLLVGRLKVEKEASESLLAMVCDASLWLGADGDTVVRSDNSFNAIIGCDAKDRQLSTFIIDSEKERLQAAIHERSMGHGSPVRLLTTTLLPIEGTGRVDADVFIVDRHHGAEIADGASQCKLGFLIGLRLTSSGSVMHENMQAVPGELAINAPHTSGAFTDTSISADQACVHKSISEHGETPPALSASGRGPPLPSPYLESEEYLRQQILGTLDDLIATMNFNVVDCCAWHSGQQHLMELLKQLRSLHSCSEGWLPPASWQCSTCLALITNEMAPDYCWLCNAERKSRDAGKGA